MDRIPPHNEEAERSALGAAMLDKDALYDVAEHDRELARSFAGGVRTFRDIESFVPVRAFFLEAVMIHVPCRYTRYR